MFLQPLKHNARKDFFPSTTHKTPAISITAMWSQREQYICQQDQVLNRPREPLNPSRHPFHWPQQSLKTPQPDHFSPIHSGYPPVFCKEDTSFTCPNYLGNPVTDTKANSEAEPQSPTYKFVFKPDTRTFILQVSRWRPCCTELNRIESSEMWLGLGLELYWSGCSVISE